jgi:hypothetical protein
MACRGLPCSMGQSVTPHHIKKSLYLLSGPGLDKGLANRCDGSAVALAIYCAYKEISGGDSGPGLHREGPLACGFRP